MRNTVLMAHELRYRFARDLDVKSVRGFDITFYIEFKKHTFIYLIGIYNNLNKMKE